MGVDMYWGDKMIGEWTEGQWARLQKVKRGEYVPDVIPNAVRRKNLIPMSSRVDPVLYEKVRVYAENKGMPLAEVLREVLFILADN